MPPSRLTTGGSTRAPRSAPAARRRRAAGRSGSTRAAGRARRRVPRQTGRGTAPPRPARRRRGRGRGIGRREVGPATCDPPVGEEHVPPVDPPHDDGGQGSRQRVRFGGRHAVASSRVSVCCWTRPGHGHVAARKWGGNRKDAARTRGGNGRCSGKDAGRKWGGSGSETRERGRGEETGTNTREKDAARTRAGHVQQVEGGKWEVLGKGHGEEMGRKWEGRGTRRGHGHELEGTRGNWTRRGRGQDTGSRRGHGATETSPAGLCCR